MNRLGLIAIVCVALIGSASSALLAADGTLTTISVINLPSDNSAVLWYAQDLGYFKDSGLDVKVTNMTNNEAITAAGSSSGRFHSVYSAVLAGTMHRRPHDRIACDGEVDSGTRLMRASIRQTGA
jgi:hypothetical protein